MRTKKGRPKRQEETATPPGRGGAEQRSNEFAREVPILYEMPRYAT
ncbi:MAG: hypothetical protein VX520_06155 [Planctomycetota bacterium]|nr:hypothetical protein [Planctomycetota bacterium]